MKKRRTLVIGLLLVAALCLGIGYAALTDDLIINGKAQFDPEVAVDELDVDVKFIAATDNDYCTAGVSGDDPTGDTAYIHIGGEDVPYELATPLQSAEATLTVQNNYEATVQVSVVTDLATVLANYNVVIDTSGVDAIPAGETGDIVVTITPKTVLEEAIDLTEFTIDLVAEVIETPAP